MKTALVIGATGLVGAQLTRLLLEDPAYGSVRVIARKPLGFSHPKLETFITSLDEMSSRPEAFRADHAFCCLGTTMRQAGSKEAFFKVDFTYTVRFAELCQQQGVQKFLLVTALGADPTSAVFYNRVKGETEEKVAQYSFDELHIFRPSLLLGPRQESRLGEAAGKWFAEHFDFLIPARYKGISGDTVAKAMIHCARRDSGLNSRKVNVHESDKIRAMVL